MNDDHYFKMDVVESGILCISDLWIICQKLLIYNLVAMLGFDVTLTYKKNKFKISVVPFIGVNHHDQYILYKGVLPEDETKYFI